MESGIRHTFEQQLLDLQDRVLRMGCYVVEMLNLSMQSLLRRDSSLAQHVVEMDDTADDMDLDIEHTCLRLLAMQQPMSRDLRIIGTAMKVITDLERIGDYSVDIAKTTRRLAREPFDLPPDALVRMASATEWMVRECVRAYVNVDTDLMTRVIERDDEVDQLYDEMFTNLLDLMERNPQQIRQATWLLHVGRFLERIADHAVNVAERVYYIEAGVLKQLATSHKTVPGS